MAKEKIPSSLYVTAKYEDENIDWGTPSHRVVKHILGFLHPHTLDKAGDKRKQTQNDWAYGGYGYGGQKWRLDNGVMWISGLERVDDPTQRFGYRMDPFDKPVEKELQPVILNNTPMRGFRVLDYVSRYSTSNKVWRILDPRGYEFEISTASFCDIIMNATIDHGEIMAECVWQSNKNLIVVK